MADRGEFCATTWIN